MTTRKAIRDDLVDVIAHAVVNSAAVRAIGFVPDAIPAPCATVTWREMDPRLVLSEAKSAYSLLVRLWVPRTSERAGQDWLDDACEVSGATSVIAAIQTGSNWTQTIDYAVVTLIGEVEERAKGDDVFLTVDLDVEIVW